MQSEDSDEDEPCAISGKWTFQRDSKRWSRLEEFDVFSSKLDPAPGAPAEAPLKTAASHESMLTELSERQEVASVLSLSSTGSLPVHAPHAGDAATPRTNSVISVCSSGHFVGNDDSFCSRFIWATDWQLICRDTEFKLGRWELWKLCHLSLCLQEKSRGGSEYKDFSTGRCKISSGCSLEQRGLDFHSILFLPPLW